MLVRWRRARLPSKDVGKLPAREKNFSGNFVATTTSLSAVNSPTRRSDTPWPYIAAVSRKFTPAARLTSSASVARPCARRTVGTAGGTPPRRGGHVAPDHGAKADPGYPDVGASEPHEVALLLAWNHYAPPHTLGSSPSTPPCPDSHGGITASRAGTPFVPAREPSGLGDLSRGGHAEGMAEWIYFIHPPRDNFAATMAAEEKDVWATHFQRFQRLLAEGVVILVGPTLGSTNTGVAIFEAPGEAAALKIMNEDPVLPGICPRGTAPVQGVLVA